MDLELRQTIYNQAKAWILKAGTLIKNKMNEPMIIDIKSNPNDLVTTIDKETEIFFANKIKSTYPKHLLLGEEGYGDDLTSLDGTVWIIDPIDGTMNFVHQKRNFAISIGVYHNGIGEIGLIYDVMGDVLYSAMKGEGAYKNNTRLKPLANDITLDKAVLGLNHRWLCENRIIEERIMQDLVKNIRGSRTYGSAALEFSYVAEGILDGYLAMQLEPWDIAAGIILVNEVGGNTSNGDGTQVNMLKRNLIITCNSKLHHTILVDYLQKGKK